MQIFRGKFNLFNYAENEAITIIAPTTFRSGESIYALWKWTCTPPGCSATHFSDVGMIHADIINGKTETKIKFSHDNYYFDITVGSGLKSLILVPTLRDGTTLDSASLHQTYSQQIANGTSTPRIYTGNIDCNHQPAGLFADDEMFVVVVPGRVSDQQSICAFWQWSKMDEYGTTKENEDCLDRIQSVAVDSSFTFTHGSKYTFEGEISEDGKRLRMMMKHSAREVLGSMDLQELHPTPMSQNVFSFVTSAIKNDTDEVVYCTLKEVKDSTVDTALAVGGLALGLLGFPGVISLLVKSKDVVEMLGDVVGVAGAVAGVGGFAQFVLGELPVQYEPGPLLPGATHKRTTSGQPGSDNSVQIIRAWVDQNRILRVDSFNYQPLGENSANPKLLKTIIDDPATKTNLLSFQLPPAGQGKTLNMTTTSLAVFPRIVPSLVAGGPTRPPHITKVEDIVENEMFTAANTAENTVGLSLSPKGLLWSLLQTAKDGPSKTFFKYSPSRETQIAVKNDTEYELLGLPDGRPVLKFKNATLERPTGPDSTPDSEIKGDEKLTTDDLILGLIYKDANSRTPQSFYWAYRKREDTAGKSLYGSSGGDDIGLKYAEDKHIYIVANKGPKIFRRIKEISA